MPCHVCERILSRFNAKVGSKYPGSASYMPNIHARHEEHGVEICLAVIELKVNDWLYDEQMRKYLTPETIFRPSKFLNYMNQVQCGDTGVVVVKPAGTDPEIEAAKKRLWAAVDEGKEPSTHD